MSEYREIEPEQTLYLDSVAILDDKTIQLKAENYEFGEGLDFIALEVY